MPSPRPAPAAPPAAFLWPPTPCVIGVIGHPARNHPADQRLIQRWLRHLARPTRGDYLLTAPGESGAPWFVAQYAAAHDLPHVTEADPDLIGTISDLLIALIAPDGVAESPAVTHALAVFAARHQALYQFRLAARPPG